MTCPACNVDLLSARPRNVHVQFCPKCGGIWLDHAEIEKMLKLARASTTAAFTAVIPGGKRNFYGHCRSRR